MKIRALPLLMALCLYSVASAETISQGVWRTVSDQDGQPRGLVEIEEIDGILTGRIIGSLREGEDPEAVCAQCSGAQHGKRLVGMEILWDLKRDPKKPNIFKGGWVIDPDTGAKYRAKVTFSPDGKSLSMRGYIGIESVGRTQVWTRQAEE